MRVRLLFPSWQRIEHQTHYALPPLGVAVVAALTPPTWEVAITDENVAPVDFGERPDLVGISAMLVCQLPRAFELSRAFRERGVPVVLGGLAATSLADLAARHADAVVLGEAEGVWPRVLEDAARRRLRSSYRRQDLAAPEEIPPARRELLDPARYTYRGVRMMDLLETSRGCRFKCFPCLVPRLTGTCHRSRPIGDVARELGSLTAQRVFIVDNNLSQDPEHERRLFNAIAPAGKRWVSHPISTEPGTLALARKAGCWYVYQPIISPSQEVRRRIALLHDHDIGVEGTVLLGSDAHGPDVFERMVDFLLECGLDLAEFTVLTPFPGTAFFDRMKRAGRLLHEDWTRYNAENVVFKPRRMTPARLAQGYRYCWERFYKERSQAARMAALYRRVSGAWDGAIAAPEVKVVRGQKAGGKAVWGKAVRKPRPE
ncbi:MAG: cobalamin B12-binding domain-containing protein [Elusimicrobia bacterium]|nr:cobalamin B12-binding domain-containing protein [Elusimicrobiota bacterium]